MVWGDKMKMIKQEDGKIKLIINNHLPSKEDFQKMWDMMIGSEVGYELDSGELF